MAKSCEAAFKLMSGEVKFPQNWKALEWINKIRKENRGRVRTSVENELALWTTFENFSRELSPKVKFSHNGKVANTAEKKRRNALLGVFSLVDFQSQDPRIQSVFQANFGQMSIQWFISSCKTDAPPWYYEWAFYAIMDVSSKTWGETALNDLKASPRHMEMFSKLEPEKRRLLDVRKVMQS